MKRYRIIPAVVILLLAAVFFCSCDKDPVPTENNNADTQRDSTNTLPNAVQPWVDAGTSVLSY